MSSYGRPDGASWHPDLMQRGADELLVYHPNAASEGYSARVDPGKTAIMKIDLAAAPGNFQVEWYRPHVGLAQSGGPIQGGTLRHFVAPWQGFDVVLRLIRKKDQGRNSR